MGCKGTCVRSCIPNPPIGERYTKGNKRCTTCEKFFNGRKYCPCCTSMLRSNSRIRKYRPQVARIPN